MPLYTFVCTNEDCQEEKDIIFLSYKKSIETSDNGEVICPKCGSKMERGSVQKSAYTPSKWVASVL